MSAPPRGEGLAIALLVSVTAVWGSTFFLIHDLVRSLPAQDFLAVRFTIATAVMLLVFRRGVRSLTRGGLVAGAGLGLVYGLAQVLQTVGLERTPASRSGFLTALYVVITPVLAAAVLRQRVGARTWAAVALALLGSAVLSLGSVGVGSGELLTVLAATAYAAHIVWLGHCGAGHSATGLATVQIAAVTVVCWVAAAPDGIAMPSGTGQWTSVLYMALVAGALAMWAQTWAQARLPASRAAVVMTAEPVFAAGFAVVLGGEQPTWRLVVGGVLVLAAMVVVETSGGS